MSAAAHAHVRRHTADCSRRTAQWLSCGIACPYTLSSSPFVVQVPVEDSLARVVIDRDEQANAERQRLKQQILAAAENHEGGGGGGEVNRGFGRSDVSSWRR